MALFKVNSSYYSKEQVISFFAGLTIGTVTTYFVTKKYYRKIADKEISEITDRFGRYIVNDLEKYDHVVKQEPVPVKDIPAKGPQEEPSPDDPPYIISVEDFVNDQDNDKETLVYYENDGVLTDQWDHVLPALDILGSLELLDHFGEEEEDILYVRNAGLQTDYEICLEHKESQPKVLEKNQVIPCIRH